MRQLLYFTFLIGFVFCSTACSEKKLSHINLKIIQTTDVHGTIFPYDFITQKEVSNSLANIYSFVKETRVENPDAVILLDNGDYLQGQPIVYYYNFEDTTSPHIGARVFNYMNYDATTVGNHDIETGHAVYDRYRKQLNMPYLAANAIIKGTDKPYFEPYTIINRQGAKVAVLGLVTPGIPKWLPEKLWQGMVFEDMVETANKWMKIIKEKEKPDLIIGMFHSGIDYTYENPDGETYMNENATRLVAEQVSGFDIVLAGHDHQKYFEKLVNIDGDTVILLDAMSHSRAVSLINVDFVFDKTTDTYKKQISAEIKPIVDYKADEDFMNQFSSEYQTIKDYVGRQIGEFSKDVDSKWAYFGNSSFMDFIHEVQMQEGNADVSFLAPLDFQSKIKKGPIYVSDLFKLYKYENLLYTISLTGNEIDGFLEYSTSLWFNTMTNNQDNLLKLKKMDNGNYALENKYYNFSSASGIDYLIDVTKPVGEKVKILGFSNRNPFYKDSTYLVALNSYRGAGGGGHLAIGSGLTSKEMQERLVESTAHDIRFLIMKWIEEKKVVHPKQNSNWRIIPEDYYEFGKRRDMKLLFGEE
ncbi:MAG: bifunctional metallophosphatase/5'-nucleotidase [Salinivirgaceae bacterium]|jgi:2',3'-cyclic-nucleotide 2'-phosphodiesterase/3'-nucleotidase|nr:bifunctional metallophosphatase/5'-nucleotidase [Salinivirgaceae bacterium]